MAVNQNGNPWAPGFEDPEEKARRERQAAIGERMAKTQPVAQPTTPPELPPEPTYQADPNNPYASGTDELRWKMAHGQDPGYGGLIGAQPEYKGIMEIGPNGERRLASPYSYDPHQSAQFNKLAAMGNQQAPTDIYKQQTALIDQNTGREINSLNADTTRGYETGLSNLAQSGGLDSGARERLQTASQQSGLNASSNVYAQSGADKAQAGVNDAQLKVNLMGSTADAETNANRFNVQNAIGDTGNFNAYSQNAYGQIGDIYGSGKSADDMDNEGGKGGPMTAGYWKKRSLGSMISQRSGLPGAKKADDWGWKTLGA